MAGRYGSDKEVSAITFNMKEQRCLEKSLQTLTLEKTYSLKLLDLDHRIIRVNYRKLKERVSRIKSNLSADEISELRRLEAAGKLKPTYNSVNISGALKIASAARRLKFHPHYGERASSAHPRLTGRDRENGNKLNSELPVMCRSNSVTGVFTDAPSVGETRTVNGLAVADKPRPFSAFTVGQSAFEERSDDHLDNRPATASCVDVDKNRLSVSRPTTGISSSGHTHSPFSSHSLAERDARVSSVNGRHSRESRSVYPSDDSIDTNLGEDLHEERRLELLEEEQAKSEELEHRKRQFLQDIDEYLQKSTPVSSDVDLGLTAESIRSESVGDNFGSGSKGRRLSKRRQMKVDFDHTPTYLPEAEYRRRLFDLWKDMNKCRYLRVPQELIDLSGIATLAKDQMKLFELLRQTAPDSLAASAEL